jgi:hypothetical protein
MRFTTTYRPAGARCASSWVGLLLWFTPVLLAGVVFGRHSVFVQQGCSSLVPRW